MKEKVTGIISFLGAISWILFILVESINVSLKKNVVFQIVDFIMIFLILITSISIVLYVKWTDFGKKDLSDIAKVDNENQLLKRLIEQKELKKKLEE